MTSQIPKKMHGVVLSGYGGPEKLEYRDDLPVPQPSADEVLIRVGACGMNNTDINTRTGWYSKTVTGGTTGEAAAGCSTDAASTWGGGSVDFPRIQGADVAGRIVTVGKDTDSARVGQRVLVDPWLRDPSDPTNRDRAGYLGSERDGGFAQYLAVPAINAFPIETELTDAELATFPCSSSTAEYLLSRSGVAAGETVLISGASGGVGSAAVQLAKRRGATVVALAGADKREAVQAVGADHVLPREADLVSGLADISADGRVDVVIDVVGGAAFPGFLNLLRRGGRYATSGAIAGPIVELDLRTLYLNDLALFGATVMPRAIFANLVGYIADGEVRPLLAETFPLGQIHEAQERFLKKRHVGNFVLVPPSD